ncbi:F-box/FBD/LRR-repeat-like protein isoform X1 [Cinnamomum micranthum f. kanehirae]|uniref:F-box/FBD/LRR-repeat-like protein isoform X1 n=1 Tax=Cinnamomum micranthum f. kanehirae TaxID=337451 RepID=A0A443NS14_9MAGN|nr:F-box/FBD/LRR-repeat-like protein isoform X1 [Cinnamomum micranthum f. kanehirae]
MKLVDGRYDVPSSIFNCQELYHLELIFSRLKVPPTFKGFQNLLVLTLDLVSISKDDIARLISKCPLLERLKLLVNFFDRFHIHAPNLRYLEVGGCFQEFSLGNSPLLTNVSIEFNMAPTNPETDNTCSLTKFIGCSYGIERLALNNSVIQFFCLAGVPEKLFVTLEHLKYLEVEIDLNSTEILPILCILRSSPNLEELKIQYGVDSVECRINLLEEGAKFWGELTRFDCLLNHLRAVEIIGLGMLLDLELIKCMLSNAPILEKMIIYTNEFVEAEEVLRIQTELLQFQRASAQARIIYLGHYKPFG